MSILFEPTRAAGLEALRGFLPHAGVTYRSKRNYNLPGHPHVSKLSPYLRHRIVTEQEVLEAVLARHSASASEKFVQEVFWRTYFKGWLEMRPSVWTAYRAEVLHLQDRLATEGGLRRAWEQACHGQTGNAAFDAWAQELVQTGYLHNHARMWFASIWTFTLGLPWQLGADFFLRHLIDGDPASNTLGWRWVVGLHTQGKVYAARASNIASYTEGRYGTLPPLANDPAPAEGTPNPPRSTLPVPAPWDPKLKTGLLLTEDDLSPGWLLDQGLAPVATAVLSGASTRSPLAVSDPVLTFTAAAIEECLNRYADRLGTRGPVAGVSRTPSFDVEISALRTWATDASLQQIVVPHPPAGPSADRIALLRTAMSDLDVLWVEPQRAYDRAAWPHATHGFFRFKGAIPSVLASFKGLRAV